MGRLRAALARFFADSDPKGCAYGEPRCPGGKLCKHDRAEIRNVDPLDLVVDDSGDLVDAAWLPPTQGRTARALQAQRAREGKSYINERGQYVDPACSAWPQSAYSLDSYGDPIVHDSSPTVGVDVGPDGLIRYSVPWPESVGGHGLPIDMRQAYDAFVDGAPLTADGNGGGSYALHNVVDRERQVDELTSGSTDPETRSIAHDALDDAFLDSLDRSE